MRVMNTFVTHPSVRIRGTENNYEPVQCLDPSCHNKSLHMHCPFCVKTESYHDPVILKAHYRVKHVDKGIEFAGLKILRCCDHCDIVGTIKGVKEFKGAHWHCYRCKNGFNRRDEAIKHYRTHFRNPQTTFQIQVAQEVNNVFNMGQEVETATGSLTQDDLSTIHPALTEAVMSTSATETVTVGNQPEATLANGRSADGELHVAVAANETVGTSEGQTIMIIQEEQLESGQVQPGVNNSTATIQIQNTGNLQFGDALGGQRTKMEFKVGELLRQIEQIAIEKSQMEQKFKAEIAQLKAQVQMQAAEISAYQRREQELIHQLSIPLDNKVTELLQQLKSSHEELLHQQLAQLRRAYVHQLTPVPHSNNPIIIISDPGQTEEANGDGDGNHSPVPVIMEETSSNIVLLGGDESANVNNVTANGGDIMQPEGVDMNCVANTTSGGNDESESTHQDDGLVIAQSDDEIHNNIISTTHSNDVTIQIVATDLHDNKTSDNTDQATVNSKTIEISQQNNAEPLTTNIRNEEEPSPAKRRKKSH